MIRYKRGSIEISCVGDIGSVIRKKYLVCVEMLLVGWCSFFLQLHNTKPRAIRPETADWSPVTDLSPILDVSPTLERAEQELMQRFQVNPLLSSVM